MEDPYGVNDAMNICMLLDLSLAAGSEVAMIAQQWDTELESNTLTSYSNTTTLMSKNLYPLSSDDRYPPRYWNSV